MQNSFRCLEILINGSNCYNQSCTRVGSNSVNDQLVFTFLHCLSHLITYIDCANGRQINDCQFHFFEQWMLYFIHFSLLYVYHFFL